MQWISVVGEINKGVNKGVVRVEIWEGQTVRARLMMRKQLGADLSSIVYTYCRLHIP